jgi:DNA-binding transcriptional regulator YiaG
MAESTVNERLKILVDKLGLSVNAFSEALGVPGTTTRNYLVRGTNPKSEFLAKITRRFEHVNPNWLLLGEGEMMLPGYEPSQVMVSHTKNNYGNNVGNNRGTVSQHTIQASDRDALQIQLTLAQQEIESLRTQLANKDALLASKDETIAVLKSAFNRPN